MNMRVHGRGGAGGGLSSVTTDATLTGAGTGASPLKVANPFPGGWPVSIWIDRNNSGGTAHSFPTNTLDIYGVQIDEQVQFSQLYIEIDALDAGHNYDVGLYNFAGTLLANIGAQPLPATGNLFFNTVQGLITINPAIYWLVFTGAASTAQYGISFGQRGTLSYATALATQASAGGACPATITPLAKSYTTTKGFFGLVA